MRWCGSVHEGARGGRLSSGEGVNAQAYSLLVEERTSQFRRVMSARDSMRSLGHLFICTATIGCPLLDHLVGGREQRRRHVDAKRLGGLEVNDQLELSRLHDWQVGRPLSLKNLACVDAYLAICIGKSGSIADQSSGCGKFAL